MNYDKFTRKLLDAHERIKLLERDSEDLIANQNHLARRAEVARDMLEAISKIVGKRPNESVTEAVERYIDEIY